MRDVATPTELNARLEQVDAAKDDRHIDNRTLTVGHDVGLEQTMLRPLPADRTDGRSSRRNTVTDERTPPPSAPLPWSGPAGKSLHGQPGQPGEPGQPPTSSVPPVAVDLDRAGDVVPFGTAVRTWFVISLQTFGGPAGQIAVMQRALVEDKRWIGQQRFLHALSYCTLLPGPEAQQLAIYLGWLLNGTRGGLAAGTLFVLPGVVALLALSAVYVAFGTSTAVLALFAGLAPAVLAIVAQAVVRVGKRALASRQLVALAVAAFLALTVVGVPFPAVVALAAAVGWLLGRYAPHSVKTGGGHGGPAAGPPPLIPDDALHAEQPRAARAAKILVVGGVLWAAPLIVAGLLTGRHSVYTEQGLFFSGAALVTFGGAYAVLAYVAQQAVQVYGWLAPGEMVRGLALAETTPGPLVMVVQFVAFVGAYRDPGGLNPWAAATIAALLTTWVTFVPCFLFIFLGAPYVERLRGNHAISAALTGITAAVVGVIANLGVYFALLTLFRRTTTWTAGPADLELPQLGTLRPVALIIALTAAVMIFRLSWPVLRTLGVCALLGLAAGLIGLPVT